MKFYFLFVFLLITNSCSKNSDPCRDPKVKERESLVNLVQKQTIEKLKKEKGLYPIGSGGCTMRGIQQLYLAFMYMKPLNIDESRVILVEAVQKFVKIVNSEERIHQYLKNDPFEPKNVEMHIVLRNPDGSKLKEGALCLLVARDGILKYEADEDPSKLLRTIYQETYQEALEKVKTQQHLSEKAKAYSAQ